MKSFWYKTENFGDRLTPIIIEYFLGELPEYVEINETGKLLAIGSILTYMKENDVIWGAGVIEDVGVEAPKGVTFLAVRGPISREAIIPMNIVPEIYGDPALLLPLMYNPKIEKTHEVGIIPHYIDKDLVRAKNGEKVIDIEAGWKEVINEVLSCKKIISSSLHGIIIAEAYGIPAVWSVYSNQIIGGQVKFQDYFLGTGRERQEPLKDIPPIKNLEKIQQGLIKALKDYYKK